MKFKKVVQSKIVKKDNKYQVQSEKGKNLGTYDTKSEAEERLKQVEMFKHMKKESKNFTLEDANKLFEEEMHKKGFPSDEELMKGYKDYVNSEESVVWETLGGKPTFEEYKQMALKDFSNRLNPQDLKTPKKWHLDDEWIETDDDPIEEPKDVEAQ